ncbi:MAG: phosphotransferase [Thermodesulfobacteriota bacterium]
MAELQLKTTGAERQSIPPLLKAAGVDSSRAKITVLVGDGSDRRFLRVGADERSLVVVLPNLASEHGLAESRAAWFIGNHLQACGVPVPRMYGYDPATGIVVCEDLGDRLLQQEVVSENCSDDKLGSIYGQIVELLARMQIEGRQDFIDEWCWDTKVYDRQLMLARESGYFMESCCQRLLGLTSVPVGLQEDFVKLADLASSLPIGFFLHRDFQSRNIMLKDGQPRFIDFQGGRLGPLGYDLASLLIDPYVSLPDSVRERLLQKYIEVLADYPGGVTAFSVEGYYLLALQRNLQILGAFAFLATVKKKSFFLDYLGPAALNLHKLLDEPVGRRFPVMRGFAAELPGLLENVLVGC